MSDELIKKIDKLFYGFMKEARRNSFMDFEDYFKEQGISLG